MNRDNPTRRKITLIATTVFVLAIALLFVLPAINPPMAESGIVRGNTNGNITNGSRAVISGEWIYYASQDTTSRSRSNAIFRMKPDGSAVQKIRGYNCASVHAAGDRIYFYGYTRINSINLDGGDDKEVCSSTYPHNLFVVGDRIYYLNYAFAPGLERYQLYSVKTDGTDEQKLCDDYVTHFNIEGERIYYRNIDKGALYSIKTDGSGRRRLTGFFAGASANRFIGDFIVEGNRIYFMDSRSSAGLYVMNTNGALRRKIGTDKVTAFNIDGEQIYYSNASDGDKLYVMNLDGSSSRKLCDSKAYYINIVGDWIFYTDSDFSGTLYRIKKDGTEQQEA